MTPELPRREGEMRPASGSASNVCKTSRYICQKKSQETLEKMTRRYGTCKKRLLGLYGKLPHLVTMSSSSSSFSAGVAPVSCLNWAPCFLKSSFATLETGRSGFLASSEINVVEEVQRSRTCRETVGVDEDTISYCRVVAEPLWASRDTAALILHARHTILTS